MELENKSVFNCEPEYLNSLMKKIPATLFVNQYIILQDPNTLKMLADNLQRKQSFSSGCMLSHLQSAKKKQLYFNNSTGLYLSFNYTRNWSHCAGSKEYYKNHCLQLRFSCYQTTMI